MFYSEYSPLSCTELQRYESQAAAGSSQVEQTTAQFLAANKLVGWFQDRMEFGQRALGHRSILADPRDATNKDRVNSAVKFRESFRPFAPAVLDEDFDTFYDAPGEACLFMEMTLPTRVEASVHIPAAVHVDGSSRPQRVTRDYSPRFHRLITEFTKISGIGAVLNTSFNLNEEPIVCTPKDALKTFFASGLDALVLGDMVVEK